jgi:NADH pyrophosphatase NudC (nudix superfamily)
MSEPEKPQERYVQGSEWNKAWRYCPKCGHKLLIDDAKEPLEAPRFCPACKTPLEDRKPMSEALETKLERLAWVKL